MSSHAPLRVLAQHRGRWLVCAGAVPQLVPARGRLRDTQPVAGDWVRLDDGGAIGVASLTTDGAKKSPYYAADASTRLYANHAYYVQEVDVEAGTVTLVNPWGLRSYAPVTLPYTDYLQQFRQVDMNEVR